MRNITLWMKKKIPSTQRCIQWTHNQVLKLLISGREVKENEFKASEQSNKQKIKEKRF